MFVRFVLSDTRILRLKHAGVRWPLENRSSRSCAPAKVGIPPYDVLIMRRLMIVLFSVPRSQQSRPRVRITPLSRLRGGELVRYVHVTLGPWWCARASPRCEDAAGKADALPAHGPTVSPRDKHAAEVRSQGERAQRRVLELDVSQDRELSARDKIWPGDTPLPDVAAGPAPSRMSPSADHQTACTAARSRFSTTPASVSPQKSSTVQAADDHIETTSGYGKTRGVHTPGTTPPSGRRVV
ncbi:hypothetical protein VTO73DRAFT_10354 [Trametes versicolor]